MSHLFRSDSFESYSRKQSTAGIEAARRKSSQAHLDEASAKAPPIGAYEVPRSKRIAQVAAAVVYCLFAAGIVFGYAALKPVLIKERVYRDQCTKKEIKDGVEVCYNQELRLNAMFTVAAVATNVCAFPVGAILDRFGPRVCGFIGCVFLAAGSLFMAFARDMRPAEGYIPGYLFLALGGPFVFISSFQLSNTFPQNSGLILALLTGAFDSSSAIFLFYRLIYTASKGALRLKPFFSAYLIVPALILIVQIFLMPKSSYKTVAELVAKADEVNRDPDEPEGVAGSPSELERLQNERRERRESMISEITALIGDRDPGEHSLEEERKRSKSGVWGALHGRSAWQQMKTWWFVFIALFTVLQMLRINYFVATIRSQYTYLLKSAAKAKAVNQFFDVALPVGGILSIPFIGLVLDNTSTPFVLGLLVTIATTIGVLGVLPYTWAAYANVVLFCLYRPFYYTAVSDYSAKVFGFLTFGKVYGTIVCAAGLFNFVQTPLYAVTHEVFDDDPIPVNVILLVAAAAVGVIMVSYVSYRSYSIDREMLEQEAGAATDAVVPFADQRVNEDHHPIDVHGGSNYGTVQSGQGRS